MQVQGHRQAIRLTGGNVKLRLFGGAHHRFDRGTAITTVADASVSPAAPTAYLADDGAFIHPNEDAPDANLNDRVLMIHALKSGYGRKGAKIGSRAGEAELFKTEMLTFWKQLFEKSAGFFLQNGCRSSFELCQDARAVDETFWLRQ